MTDTKHIGPNSEDRLIREITNEAETVLEHASVESALATMDLRGVSSSTVVDDAGAFMGSVCTDDMRRNVGGSGHDPKTEAVVTQLNDAGVTCFEDQTISEANRIMLEANVDEVSVLTRESVLVGTAKLLPLGSGEIKND